MAATHRPVPTDVSLNHLEEELPQVPDAWEQRAPDEAPFRPRTAWQHREAGLWVTVQKNRKPTQMHTPETSTDDTGWSAQVYREDSTGKRLLSHELGAKVKAYEAAIRFMAKYPDGSFEIPERDGAWDDLTSPVEW